MLRDSRARVAILEFGAGSAVPTVRYTSETVARELGARLIRVNPREAEVSAGHLGVPLGALEGIQALAAHMRT